MGTKCKLTKFTLIHSILALSPKGELFIVSGLPLIPRRHGSSDMSSSHLMLIFIFILLLCGCLLEMSVFTSFIVKKKKKTNTLHYFSHTVPCCHISIHPLSKGSVLATVSLRLSSQKSLVCSDWPALTGLSKHHVFASALQVFLIPQQCWGRYKYSCDIKTLRKSWIWAVWISSWIEHFDNFTVFI